MCSKAIAIIKGPYVYGVIKFHQCIENRGTNVYFDLYGMKPNKKMACHIHEFGDCSAPDAMSAGGHFNPAHTDHGSLNTNPHHAGDFGNLIVNNNAAGVVHEAFTSHSISFSGDNAILGRGLIVHANADDLHSQPAGNSGSRIACGIIGIMKP